MMPSKFSFGRYGRGGIEMSELLPNLSTVADELCVIRSMFTTNPNHEQARSMFHQGSMILSRPSMGSWISYGLGTENKNLPAFMVLAPDGGGFTTAGFLPAEYQGTSFNTFEMAPDKMIRFLRNTQLSTDDQRQQLDLTQALNRTHQEVFGADAFLEGRIASMEAAFTMQFAAMDTLDTMKEPESVREEYGATPFAQGCLMARRLVESGVRFVVVHYGPGQPWDDHKEIDRNLRERCPNMDKASAALIRDLKRRGLLDETLVVWGGEFGRTPVSESGDGRDHNPYGFSMFLAGGGVKGGMTYGASDEFGFRAVENRVSIHDLHATILHQLGIDHERLTYRYAGRDFRLTDVFGNVVKDILL
jgi:arylsulfatase A-like enzyme